MQLSEALNVHYQLKVWQVIYTPQNTDNTTRRTLDYIPLHVECN